MIQPEYQLAYTATAATTTIATGNINLHTINIPKASAGALSYTDSADVQYFYLPTASIGTFICDCVLNNGLKIVQASAADYVTTTWKQG